MLFSGCPRIKRSEILSFTCLGIFLAGVEPVFARLEFSNHLYPPVDRMSGLVSEKGAEFLLRISSD